MRYQVILERGANSVGAYVPDLPGCIAVGATREEALRLIRQGIEFHIDGLREAGEAVPAPGATLELVEVDAA
jgi:predicted RNase H-like HicB family nuclease